MPLPGEGRRGHRFVGGLLVVAAALSLVGLAPTSSYAVGDDYPYRGMGQCPLVPLPPHPPGTQPGQSGSTPGHPGSTPGHAGQQPGTKPGQQPGTKPGQKPGDPPGQKPGTPNTPPPPRVCAKHIWFIGGSYGDPWGFALRNCTSFVAWRLRETNGLSDFSNYLDGGSWGDAWHWDDNARALGYLVDHEPAVGAVAQTDDGAKGHVAWVSAVGDGTVTVEEYNYNVPGGYDVRTVPTSDFRYLHLDDVAPPPTVGSDRAAASAVDARAGTWTARTTPQGDLSVRRPSGRVVRLGLAGSWSPYAAPSLVADTRGRVWLSAVARDGRLLVAHTTLGSARWTRPAAFRATGWSTTSTPTLVVDRQGRLRLFAVTATGDLVARRTASRLSDRWSLPVRMGRPGSWSAHTAPSATLDRYGRLWLVAVTRGGSLQARHTHPDGSRWSGFRPVDGRTWSVTSSPALATGADGRLRLATVTSLGRLYIRQSGRPDRWRPAARLPGRWSPYASPSLAIDGAGRIWLAATRTSGRVDVRVSGTQATRWVSGGRGPVVGSEVGSPALAAVPGGGVRVGAVAPSGRVMWRLLGARAPSGPRPTRLTITAPLRFQP